MQFDMFTEKTASVLNDIGAMQQLLQRWVDRKWLRALDAQLPQTLNQLAHEPNPLVWLLSALLCHQYGRGHSCILLEDLLKDADGLLSLPPQNQFLQRFSDRPSNLLQHLSVYDYQQALQQSSWLSIDSPAPLVLEDNRLYLHRLYQAEQLIKLHIKARVQSASVISPKTSQALSELFPNTNNSEPDWQKLACVMALTRRFAIITGGPGTGKTTTVVKLLALMQQSANNSLTIKLAAPTGKAAVRLTESISGAIGRLPEHLSEKIPTEVTTLHRLLGAVPNRRSFKHHKDNPLQLDVLVVDEASMIDLEMMAAMLDALPDNAKLVLLGDKDQLASVEAGSVLGDLCKGAKEGGYDKQTLNLLQPYSTSPLTAWQGAGTLLNQATVMLRFSHRFDEHSGIGQFALAVNNGDNKAAALFDKYSDIELLANKQVTALKPIAVQGFGKYIAQMHEAAGDNNPDAWAQNVLKSYSEFQLLCALRTGEWGVEGVNEQVANWLNSAGLLHAKQQWYAGRPVMMQRNNYNLGLMNGDIGITLKHPTTGELRVVFQLADGSLKWVLPSRLSDVETAFAMTVHKSQGSEFTHCCLVLPPDNSPILTRELLYTGITRAKKRFTLLCANPEILNMAISKQVNRSSGL